MNTLLLTFALLGNQAPAIDTEQWFDLESMRADMTTYVREEASQVASFIKTSIRDGLEAGAAMLELTEARDDDQQDSQQLAKSE